MSDKPHVNDTRNTTTTTKINGVALHDLGGEHLWEVHNAPWWDEENSSHHEKIIASLDGITFILGQDERPGEHLEEVLIVRDRRAMWVYNGRPDWQRTTRWQHSDADQCPGMPDYAYRYRLQDLSEEIQSAVLSALDREGFEWEGEGDMQPPQWQ